MSRKLEQEVKNDKPAFSKDITFSDVITPVFVIPPRNNRRISNQKGAFVLFGLSNYFEKSKPSVWLDEVKTKTIYLIPQKQKSEILKELRFLGIDKSFVYPEIDDVAEDIKSR